MKNTVKLLLAVTMAAFCCSIGKADNIIYSNNFALGTGIDISNTPPTVANTYAGGVSSARWADLYGASNPNPGLFLLDNGVNQCPNGDYWSLPFTPQTNNIYLLTVNLTFTNNPGVAPEFGFSTNLNTVNADGRFNGIASGYDWMAPTESSGNIQYFSGPKASAPSITIANVNSIFPANTPSTNTFQILLNTKSNLWSAAGYVNGVQAGSLFTYSATIPNPTNIMSVGISLNGSASLPTAVQYNSFTLTTTLQPFIVQQPTATKILGGGSLYTNSVQVMADTNGGTLSYQWYANNLPLVNGVNNISGANSNTLVINPIGTVNQASNYYVIVSNNFGSATSAVASVTVLTNITITAPTSLSNPITLFAGSGGTAGSSPSFSVTAVGAPTLTYEWLTNGVPVPGATKNSLSFTNIQGSGPATFTCIVSNSFGPTNVTWNATYVSAPTAAYPQLVLGAQPFDFWRLNESDDGNGNLGAICHDYGSGNNGLYTNVTLGQTGYNTLESSETSMFVSAGFAQQPSCVSRMIGGDLAAIFTNGTSATFAVEAWANCISGNGSSGGAPVVAQGTNGGSSFFLGVDTNSVTKHYQFYVRNAAGTMFSADDTTVQADDLNWHYLVGVCDEVHSNVSLYIDGILAATATITPATGLFESGLPVAIGAGIRIGASDYNIPFTGNIDDVAIYGHALTYSQVINHFSAVNNNKVALTFQAPLVPANFVYLANRTLTIPATIDGSGPISYTWTDVTSGTTLASGSTTNSGSLDATLTIPNAPASMSGDQLQLAANNSVNSLNATVNLTVQPAPVALDYSSPILYSNAFNGGTYNLAGLPPSDVNLLVGGTNTLWIDGKVTNNGVMQANGTPTSTLQDSWVLPFTPEPGYIYTLTATVAFTANPGNWVALGFFQNLTNAADARINGGLNGYDWLLVQFSGNVQSFAGPAGTGPISNAVIATVGVATHTIKIVLDTTTNSANWMGYSFVDGNPSGTNKYTTKPTVIGGVGIAQNAPTVPSAIQWSSFALTQVAPGGVPPYLLSPLPPTNNIVLSNATVAINATAFGSAPFGYYWTNSSTVIASGTTSTMTPLSANLNIASSSLSAGTLKLVVTNAFGTNITTITLVSPVNTNAGPIQYSVTNNQLNLSWPTNLGWTLQAQTNSAGAGISTNSANWFNVANSTTTNKVTVPISTTNGSVFYRLILP